MKTGEAIYNPVFAKDIYDEDGFDALSRYLPPIGDIVFGFFRIQYTDNNVNLKTHLWVNFDDDLSPDMYPKLYLLYGDTLSVNAADGMFNLAKLADRFPLVSSENFKDIGGESKVSLTASQNGPHTHGVNSFYSSATTGVATHVLGGDNYIGAQTKSSGQGEPHNNMPPYIKICAHVRAG